jgi:hypothetical protein
MGLPRGWSVEGKQALRYVAEFAVKINEVPPPTLVFQEINHAGSESVSVPVEVVVEVLRANGWKVEAPVRK